MACCASHPAAYVALVVIVLRLVRLQVLLDLWLVLLVLWLVLLVLWLVLLVLQLVLQLVLWLVLLVLVHSLNQVQDLIVDWTLNSNQKQCWIAEHK